MIFGRKLVVTAGVSPVRVAVGRPLTLAWVAANRVTINGNVHCPEERVSLHTALKAITIDAAWIVRKEDEIGSIRAGKKADFAVLEENPYRIGVQGLKDIGIWGTVFEGEVQYIRSDKDQQ